MVLTAVMMQNQSTERDNDQPGPAAKRRRFDHSPPKSGRADTYRPGREDFHDRSTQRGSRSRGRHASYRPSYPPRPRRPTPPPQTPQQSETGPDLIHDATTTNADTAQDAKNKNHKSKKERKENPSSRIHSLRRLLSRGTLPRTVHQEKERELASLLFEQQKATYKSASRKNLKRYHFIRFMERKKAQRQIKKLQTQLEDQDQQNGGEWTVTDKEEIEKQIHIARVDLNYALYAPLGQKYISIYAAAENSPNTVNDNNVRGKKPSKYTDKEMVRLSGMNKRDLAILDDRQKAELQAASEEAGETLNLAGSGTEKPPMWYEIEAAMSQGGQERLEKLRDGKIEGGAKTLNNAGLVTAMGGKADAEARVNLHGKRARPDWLDDDGMIDAEDLDSGSEDEDEDENGGVSLSRRQDEDEEDEEMSDGDGGFFERR